MMKFDSDPNSGRIDITQESPSDLAEYATVPIAFEVREIARVSSNAPRAPLAADAVAVPYVKDYDANGNGPTSWPSQFDLSHWAVFVARVNGQRVGGAALVHGAPDVDMLGARHDVALLWDIRVAPAYRGKGIGAALLEHGEAWARAREATWLEVETQDINVPACRFYARHEFELRVVNPDAYPELPDETQLLWYKRLSW